MIDNTPTANLTENSTLKNDTYNLPLIPNSTEDSLHSKFSPQIITGPTMRNPDIPSEYPSYSYIDISVALIGATVVACITKHYPGGHESCSACDHFSV